MNILFYLSRYPGYGGIESVTSLIISGLIKQSGIHISILTHISEDNPMCDLENVGYYLMPDQKACYTKKNFLFAERVISNNAFDAIVYQDSYAYTEKIVCSLANKYNIPLYVFEHNSPLFIYNKRGLEPITTPKGFIRRVLHPYLLHREIKRKRYLFENCKKYVLLSKTFIPEFCNLIGTCENNPKVTYINNPCIPSLPTERINKDKIILCVCQLNKTKQVDKMLMVWVTIKDKLGDWKFQIVGDGPEMANLKAMVVKYEIPRVEFIGFANPLKYYQKASIFWMMSKFEGWGLTLLESMQQGCVPVAWYSYSSLTDIVDDGVNGYVVKNWDMNSFGDITIYLANNHEELERMSMAARKKPDSFSLDKIVEDWKTLLGVV